MKKYILELIVVSGFWVTLLLSSCSNKNAAPPPMFGGPVAIRTEEVKLSGVSYYDEYPGTVVALNQIEIRPQVNGYITGIYFKDGDHVTKGQRLYTIDAQLYSANYDQAVANLQVQETNLDKAQKDADRYHALDKDDAIAKQQVDYADAALAAAKKQVAAAKANVQSVQTSVNYTTIAAPFNGTIGISLVKAQTAVTAGVTLLNTVSTDDPMAVDFVIDQKDIYHFSQLQQKGAKNVDSTFTIAFGENDRYPFSGKINFLDRAVDPQTGTLKVRLEFPNQNRLLRAGMSCNVKVRNENKAPQVFIPYKAVTEQLGDYFVFVVKGDKVSQQKIAPGNHIGDKLIVKDGLKEHDIIAVEGVQKLHEGSQILTGADTTKKQNQ
jgi:membrane fusion protein (multidrug efflux system)